MRLLLALLVLLPLPLAGCGGSNIARVSGQVTLDDRPLANAHVSFQPIAPPGKAIAGGGSYAVTDSKGRFTLLLVEGERPGAVIGNHRVEIVLRDATDDDTDRRAKGRVRVPLPARYNRNTELKFEVLPGGTSEANFPLKSR